MPISAPRRPHFPATREGSMSSYTSDASDRRRVCPKIVEVVKEWLLNSIGGKIGMIEEEIVNHGPLLAADQTRHFSVIARGWAYKNDTSSYSMGEKQFTCAIKSRLTFWMIGRIASFLEEEADAEANPFGRWESGTRIGLCLRILRFFWDLPMLMGATTHRDRGQEVNRGYRERVMRDLARLVYRLACKRDSWERTAVSLIVAGLFSAECEGQHGAEQRETDSECRWLQRAKFQRTKITCFHVPIAGARMSNSLVARRCCSVL